MTASQSPWTRRRAARLAHMHTAPAQPLACLRIGLVLALWSAPLGWAQDPPSTPADDTGPFLALTLEQAAERANEAHRMVLVELSLPGSEERAALRGTYRDDAVARFVEVETVPIALDPAAAGEIVERYRVDRLPTVLLLDADLFELDRLEGDVPARRFVKVIRAALELRDHLSLLRPRLLESPEDPELHLALARTYVLGKRLEPAVQAFDAAWRLGRGVEGFERVRTGALVGELGQLGGPYEPARKQLLRWKLEALERLSDPNAPEAFLAAREVTSIHRFHKDSEAAVALYESYRARPETPPEILAVLFDNQVSAAYQVQGRWAELAEGLGDVFVRLDGHFAELDTWRALERDGALPPGEELTVGILSRQLQARAGLYLELLLRLDRSDEAEALVDLVLLREPYAGAYLTLMRAARSASAVELAKRIGERALEQLPRKERSVFEAQAGRPAGERER